jgi:predicted nucleic acid-binding protein
MTLKIIVPDANIFTKTIYNEKDSKTAQDFFVHCLKENHKLIVPELFKYEIAQVCFKNDGDLEKLLDRFQAHAHTILTVTAPDKDTWLQAKEIADTGHEKSGYPSIYDSIYQSLAMQVEGIFLTADKKHFAKTKQFGNICLLENWETIFDDIEK